MAKGDALEDADINDDVLNCGKRCSVKRIDDRSSKFANQDVLVEHMNKIGEHQWNVLTDKAWSFTPMLVMAIDSSNLETGPTKNIAATRKEHPKATRVDPEHH